MQCIGWFSGSHAGMARTRQADSGNCIGGRSGVSSHRADSTHSGSRIGDGPGSVDCTGARSGRGASSHRACSSSRQAQATKGAQGRARLEAARQRKIPGDDRRRQSGDRRKQTYIDTEAEDSATEELGDIAFHDDDSAIDDDESIDANDPRTKAAGRAANAARPKEKAAWRAAGAARPKEKAAGRAACDPKSWKAKKRGVGTAIQNRTAWRACLTGALRHCNAAEPSARSVRTPGRHGRPHRVAPSQSDDSAFDSGEFQSACGALSDDDEEPISADDLLSVDSDDPFRAAGVPDAEVLARWIEEMGYSAPCSGPVEGTQTPHREVHRRIRGKSAALSPAGRGLAFKGQIGCDE